MGERQTSRPEGRSAVRAFRSSSRRHIDLQRVAAALCPGLPAGR
ncbi:putative leader peptide [Actinacidiphila sp. ITFR-21]